MPASGREIDKLLAHMLQNRASDLHLCSTRRARYRIDGDLHEEQQGPVYDIDTLRKLVFEIVPAKEAEEFETRGACDFAYEIANVGRYRFNVYKDHRGFSAVARLIPSEILTAEQLNLPKAVRALANLPKGLVLVTGPTGSGKSTTLATILDLVNRSRKDHIITIEAPIEFVHKDKQCLVNQREVGRHTGGFREALRDALREDPDVILVGEMRDLETISTAIETASTGHLVFGTLHTTTATSTVNRIIEIFPADQQAQVRYGLAESLKAVVAQILLKKKGGGRVAALEVLMVTTSVSNLIREQKTHQLLNQMQTGRSLGMQLLTDELVRLVKSDLVEPAEAYSKAPDRAEFVRQLGANGITFKPPADEGMPPATEEGEG
ncbi:MAG: PilT/PilU family type 4a pilus ATPase [Myxococcales bacterium]|nr:MAG: PilT/PilU family type 4a pilus ATPase [Myxococcales bacterium]